MGSYNCKFIFFKSVLTRSGRSKRQLYGDYSGEFVCVKWDLNCQINFPNQLTAKILNKEGMKAPMKERNMKKNFKVKG